MNLKFYKGVYDITVFLIKLYAGFLPVFIFSIKKIFLINK